jgi:CBS domain-containing protein
VTVSEICTREVVIIGRDEPITEAARLMREYHVGDLVVVEEREGKHFPVGIITDRDTVVGVVARDTQHLDRLAVGDVVKGELLTATEQESLVDALKRMCAFGIRRIPVLDGRGSLAGILSADDVIEELGEQMTDLAALIGRQRKRETEERT